MENIVYVKAKPCVHSGKTWFNVIANMYELPHAYGEGANGFYIGYMKLIKNNEGIYTDDKTRYKAELDKNCKYIYYWVSYDTRFGVKEYRSIAKVYEIQSKPFQSKTDKYKELKACYMRFKRESLAIKEEIKRLGIN